MLAQFKQGGGGGGMGNSMAGGYDSFMGSPSTGKCHLVPRKCKNSIKSKRVIKTGDTSISPPLSNNPNGLR